MAKTCLIAEHDPWDIQLLKLYAERLGFGITQSFETQAVVPMAQQTSPDVILLEVDLPGTFEYQEVVRRLRSDPTTSKAAIVLISPLDRNAVDCGEETGLETLHKPATYDGLQACLERAGVWRRRKETADPQEECS